VKQRNMMEEMIKKIKEQKFILTINYLKRQGFTNIVDLDGPKPLEKNKEDTENKILEIRF